MPCIFLSQIGVTDYIDDPPKKQNKKPQNQAYISPFFFSPLLLFLTLMSMNKYKYTYTHVLSPPNISHPNKVPILTTYLFNLTTTEYSELSNHLSPPSDFKKRKNGREEKRNLQLSCQKERKKTTVLRPPYRMSFLTTQPQVALVHLYY
jgi:hypothetical protein